MSKIDKALLFKTARAVRFCAEELVKAGNNGRGFGMDLGGGCGDVSYTLGQLTDLCHCFEAGSYKGWGHCWLRLPDGEIWDLTATQFKITNRIYVLKKDTKGDYVTSMRGKPAINSLKSWTDPKWRKLLRDAAREYLMKEGVIL